MVSSMSQSWFYFAEKQVMGPVSLDQLRAAVSAGQVRHDTKVRQGTSGKWCLACEMAGLHCPPPVAITAPLKIDLPAGPLQPPRRRNATLGRNMAITAVAAMVVCLMLPLVARLLRHDANPPAAAKQSTAANPAAASKRTATPKPSPAAASASAARPPAAANAAATALADVPRQETAPRNPQRTRRPSHRLSHRPARRRSSRRAAPLLNGLPAAKPRPRAIRPLRFSLRSP